MKIENLKKNWDQFGQTDPLWSILTWPEKKNNRWVREDFFRTGQKEIDGIMERVRVLKPDLSQRKALDFGCGVGRLTQALARYFDKVYGVDIAPSMLDLAEKYNDCGKKCKYFLNEKEDLKLFETGNFDFIYSSLTLQHMEPRYSKKYLKEFLRLLSPGGFLVFQLPSKAIIGREKTVGGQKKIKGIVKSLIPREAVKLYDGWRCGNQPKMEMYSVSEGEIKEWLNGCGASTLEVRQNTDPDWKSFTYFVVKNKAC